MDTRPRNAPPPTPPANDTGVVPRWRAWASTAAALAFGWGSGTYGLGNTIAVFVWTAIAVGAAVGITAELYQQARRDEFRQIEQRRQSDRALRGEP